MSILQRILFGTFIVLLAASVAHAQGWRGMGRIAGKVTSELQRGFLLNERLLRPAMVVVSLGPGSSNGDDAKSSGASGES